MEKKKSPDAQIAEQEPVGQETTGQETTGQETTGQETTGQETTGQETTGQETTGQETKDRLPLQYAVSAGNGLNLRQSPSLDAPIVAVLPCGVGVFDNGFIQNGWMEVFTGKLTGWVKAEHLEPLWD